MFFPCGAEGDAVIRHQYAIELMQRRKWKFGTYVMALPPWQAAPPIVHGLRSYDCARSASRSSARVRPQDFLLEDVGCEVRL